MVQQRQQLLPLLLQFVHDDLSPPPPHLVHHQIVEALLAPKPLLRVVAEPHTKPRRTPLRAHSRLL